MENLQGAIKRIFIFIMLFITVLCENIYAQDDYQDQREINGHVSLKIESKSLSLQDAQGYVQRKESIPLMVSAIFRGEWVELFDKDYIATINQSSFSFGIAKSTGTNKDDAPLYTDNPPAWILSARAQNCTEDGVDLRVPISQTGVNAISFLWNNQGCPTYGYGLGFTGSQVNGLLSRKSDDKGAYYELDLFRIYFKLKRVETVYVRGIDANYGTDPDNSIATTPMTTEFNLINVSTNKNIYWPGAPIPGGQTEPTVSDWTLAPEKYYGGIIPGGIFIEQSPEVAQLTPNFFS